MNLKKFSTKPNLLAVLVLFVGLLFTACDVPSDGSSKASQIDSNKVQLAIAEIKGETTVKDIHYDDKAAVQWHIGVINDGSKRYGYASYICEILAYHDVVTTNTSVRIVDIAKVVRQNQTLRKASLGRVDCNTYQNLDPRYYF